MEADIRGAVPSSASKPLGSDPSSEEAVSPGGFRVQNHSFVRLWRASGGVEQAVELVAARAGCLCVVW